MEFKDFPLSSVGNTVGLVGGVWAEEGQVYLCLFPEYDGSHDHDPPEYVEMRGDAWERLLKQSDQVETEVLSKSKDGKIYKAVIRKCTRNISQIVSWNVFSRDGFACRYCSRTHDDNGNRVPLTVDHLVLWEEGGPSTEANLVSACKKCNKTRGNTSYADWLNHPRYQAKAEALTQEQRQANLDLVATLDGIELNVHVRSKR